MDTTTYIYDEEITPIKSIDFNILGNEEIRQMSALGKDTNGIEIPDLYDNMAPKRGGMIDSRMGTTDFNIDCETCGLNSTYCVGHFGHITLAEMAYHMGYIQYIKKILSCICLKCSKLLIDKNEAELIELLKNKTDRGRWSEIRQITKKVSFCKKQGYGCGTPVSKIRIEYGKTTSSIDIISETNITGMQDEDNTVSATKKKKISQIIHPDMCYDILKNISDTDCLIMGINPETSRPENMILKYFPVPPIAVRPSSKADYMSSGNMEDDLTITLANIIKSNIKMRKHKETITESSAKFSQDHTNYLQYHIATYFNNENTPILKSEIRGKSVKSLSSRFKGKPGRIRGNLMGKRVEFSARTVITPDPTIDLNELGVPVSIAKVITMPEVVTPNNIERLQALVRNGRDKYPGANYVFPISKFEGRDNIKPIYLKYRQESVELRLGDIVERHIQNGDYVLLNRQPTLHKMSMMGHKIKVINNPSLSSFRLCPFVCSAYNADFDGDEMNIFIPQSIQTELELKEIADVKLQIISPKDSNPIIGATQDVLLGGYLISGDGIKIKWNTAMNIISYTLLESEDYLRIGKDRAFTGSELFSVILPPNMNIKHAGLEVKNGKISNGRIYATHLGKKGDSLIHSIWDESGPESTKLFIDNVSRVINNFILHNGFTVGIRDTEINKEVKKQTTLMYETKLTEINHLITEIENNPSLLDHDIFESSITEDLKAISGNVGKVIMENIPKTNGFYMMIHSGTKGNADNMGKLVACVGQGLIEGGRIKRKLNGRSLAYFHQNDDSGAARGFIKNCFIEGLTAKEFILHNMSTREGLIDTAIKTSESGYLQRRLIKALEDIKINYDCTSRNTTNNIIQYIYGDSGVDSCKQYNHTLNVLEISKADIKNNYCFTGPELKEMKNSKFTEEHNNDFFNELLHLRNIVRESIIRLEYNKMTFSSNVKLPVNIKRIIESTPSTSSHSPPTPHYILTEISRILSYESTKVLCIRKQDMNNTASMKYKDEMLVKTLFKLALYQYLSPKVIIFVNKFSKEQFDNICSRIIKNFNKSIVEPGEMIGTIAAQSIGEPLTQMTLNSFHHAGSKSATSLGVPRLREIFSFTTNMKTPVMIVYLDNDLRSNLDYANKIASYLRFTTLKDIRNNVDIYYDPEPLEKDGFMNQDNVKNIFYLNKITKYSCQSNILGLPWLMRIVLNKEAMLEKSIKLLDIKSKFCDYWENRFKDPRGLKKEEKILLEKITSCAIMSNNENDKQPILHIRFDMNNFNFTTIVNFLDIFIDRFKLKGLFNIDNVSIESNQRVMDIDKETDAIIPNSHHVLTTKGVNLIDIRYIHGIDLNNTLSNDIVETYNIFGIEAARAVLIRELQFTMKEGSFINFQHISLLCDLMTNTGTLISVDRHGMNKLDTEPLTRASFEKTVEQLLQAAVFSEVDHIESVSSRIMTGLAIKGGTGMCEIVLDTERIEKSEYIEEVKYKKMFNELEIDELIDDIIEKEAHIFIPE